MTKMSATERDHHREDHEESALGPIQQDWGNREYIEIVSISIKKITDFLNSFGKFSRTSPCSYLAIWRVFRPVLSLQTSGIKREADDFGEKNRLSGGLCK